MHDERLLVDAAWLRARLDAPTLRIIDCTILMTPRPVGPSRIESGRPRYEAAHIPGAVYLDPVEALAAKDGPTPYSLGDPERVGAALRAAGVDDDTTIVLYGTTHPMVATRTWWMLRASGARDVRVLDGGLAGWLAAGGPLTDRPTVPVRGRFGAMRVPALRATRDDVLAAIGDASTRLVNALSAEQFAGTGGAHYGRPGRIPGSVGLPFWSLLDATSGRFLDVQALRRAFADAGVSAATPAIHSGGGGVAASGTLFAAALVGRRDDRLYDHSLLEWSADPRLPMVTGA
jgi:thiosulfate/3-mercaptopyruvate sulfurtransferase